MQRFVSLINWCRRRVIRSMGEDSLTHSINEILKKKKLLRNPSSSLPQGRKLFVSIGHATALFFVVVSIILLLLAQDTEKKLFSFYARTAEKESTGANKEKPWKIAHLLFIIVIHLGKHFDTVLTDLPRVHTARCLLALLQHKNHRAAAR